MSTRKQRDANRRNAQLSSGPRSDNGKARSSLNALKHGICVSDLTLKDDEVSHAEIQAAIDQYFDHNQPETLEQRDALEELATAKVRLSLLRRVENGALNLARREVFAEHTFSDPAGNTYPLFDSANWPQEDQRTVANMHLAAAWMRSQDLLDRLSRYEGRLYQRYRRAQDRWDALQKARASAAPPPAQTPAQTPAPTEVPPASAGPLPLEEPPCDRSAPSASICVNLRPDNPPPADPEFTLIRVHSRPNNPPAQNEPNFDLTPSDSTSKEER